jgi:hypothetical protein
MATVLFTWELGGGIGHLVRIKPLAEGLAERGARVWVALRDLSQADRFFDRGKVRLVQAPSKVRCRRRCSGTCRR